MHDTLHTNHKPYRRKSSSDAIVGASSDGAMSGAISGAMSVFASKVLYAAPGIARGKPVHPDHNGSTYKVRERDVEETPMNPTMPQKPLHDIRSSSISTVEVRSDVPVYHANVPSQEQGGKDKDKDKDKDKERDFFTRQKAQRIEPKYERSPIGSEGNGGHGGNGGSVATETQEGEEKLSGGREEEKPSGGREEESPFDKRLIFPDSLTPNNSNMNSNIEGFNSGTPPGNDFLETTSTSTPTSTPYAYLPSKAGRQMNRIQALLDGIPLGVPLDGIP